MQVTLSTDLLVTPLPDSSSPGRAGGPCPVVSPMSLTAFGCHAVDLRSP